MKRITGRALMGLIALAAVVRLSRRTGFFDGRTRISLFFSDALTSKVYGTGVYKSRAAARDTFNKTDSIYASGGAQSTLTMKHDGHGGYIGTITLGVHRS